MQECMVCGRVVDVILIKKSSDPIRKSVPYGCVRETGETCSHANPAQLKFC
jgi:hypothetical protein